MKAKALFVVFLMVGLLSLSPGAWAADKGVVMNSHEAADPAIQSALQTAGVKWVRVFGTFNYFYPSGTTMEPGLRTMIEQAGSGLHARGIKLAVVMTANPPILSSDPIAPPDPVAWSNVAVQMATTLKDAVDLWEIWNEADGQGFWAKPAGQDSNAAQYAALLKTAYPKIKAADPTSRVIMGGLTGQNWPYLKELYANGAGGSFDGISLHPDTACNITSPYEFNRDMDGNFERWSFLGYRSAYQVMVDNNDGHKPIFMTESGWNTATGLCDEGAWAGQKAAGVSESTQAEFLLKQYHCLAETAYVEGAFWFNYRDLAPEGQGTHHLHYGLLRYDGSPKPAWDAFVRVGTPAGALSGPCGDTSPPSLSITSPKQDMSFTDQLVVKVTASDPSGVARIYFSADGGDSLWSEGVTEEQKAAGQYPTSITVDKQWMGAKQLELGKHTFTILVRDRWGNMLKKNITINKVAAPTPVDDFVVSLKGRVKIDGQPLSSFLAPVGTCPNDILWTDYYLPQQREALLCLINYARKRAGRAPLKEQPELTSGAEKTAEDMAGFGSNCSAPSSDPLREYRRRPNFCGRSIHYHLFKSGFATRDCLNIAAIYQGGRRLASPHIIYKPRSFMRYLLFRKKLRPTIFKRRFGYIALSTIIRYEGGGSESKFWNLQLVHNDCEN